MFGLKKDWGQHRYLYNSDLITQWTSERYKHNTSEHCNLIINTQLKKVSM